MLRDDLLFRNVLELVDEGFVGLDKFFGLELRLGVLLQVQNYRLFMLLYISMFYSVTFQDMDSIVCENRFDEIP